MGWGIAGRSSLWLCVLLLAAALAPTRGSGELAEDAAPAQESAQALLDRAFSNLYADDYVQVLELATRARGGQEMSRRLQITRKQSERPGKALMRFLEPASVRRTSVLVIEREGGSDNLFVYLPAIDFTRRISGAQRADAFFGTDLSYEDVEPKRAADWLARFADSPARVAEGCVPLEILAREGFDSTYERMRSCIEPERAVIVWTEFYRGGELVKRLEIDRDEVRRVGERSIPFSAVMKSARAGSETRLETESYDIRRSIPDSLFSTWNLAAGDAKRDRARSK